MPTRARKSTPRRRSAIPPTELTLGGYPARAERNVGESDATLIRNLGKLAGGSRVTAGCAQKHGKALLVVQLDQAS